jgi:hypothetical protein
VTPSAGERVVLVLSGGGVKAAAHLGAVRALIAAGLKPTRYVGTSMGAVVATGLAAGLPSRRRRRAALCHPSPGRLRGGPHGAHQGRLGQGVAQARFAATDSRGAAPGSDVLRAQRAAQRHGHRPGQRRGADLRRRRRGRAAARRALRQLRAASVFSLRSFSVEGAAPTAVSARWCLSRSRDDSPRTSWSRWTWARASTWSPTISGPRQPALIQLQNDAQRVLMASNSALTRALWQATPSRPETALDPAPGSPGRNLRHRPAAVVSWRKGSEPRRPSSRHFALDVRPATSNVTSHPNDGGG